MGGLAPVVPNDPAYPTEASTGATTWHLPRIGAPDAWALRTDASAVKVCVLGECPAPPPLPLPFPIFWGAARLAWGPGYIGRPPPPPNPLAAAPAVAPLSRRHGPGAPPRPGRQPRLRRDVRLLLRRHAAAGRPPRARHRRGGCNRRGGKQQHGRHGRGESAGLLARGAGLRWRWGVSRDLLAAHQCAWLESMLLCLLTAPPACLRHCLPCRPGAAASSGAASSGPAPTTPRRTWPARPATSSTASSGAWRRARP